MVVHTVHFVLYIYIYIVINLLSAEFSADREVLSLLSAVKPELS